MRPTATLSLDVYRIGDDPDSIDLDDFLYGEGVTIIEWGELLDESLLGGLSPNFDISSWRWTSVAF